MKTIGFFFPCGWIIGWVLVETLFACFFVFIFVFVCLFVYLFCLANQLLCYDIRYFVFNQSKYQEEIKKTDTRDQKTCLSRPLHCVIGYQCLCYKVFHRITRLGDDCCRSSAARGGCRHRG